MPPLFALILSLSSIYLLPEGSFRKENYHSFTDIPSMAPITCYRNSAFPSNPCKILYHLVPPHTSGVITTQPHLSHLDTLRSSPLIWLCWNTCHLPRFCALSVPQYCNISVAPLRVLVPLLRILSSKWLHSLENSRSSCNTQCKLCVIWKTIADTVLQSYWVSLFPYGLGILLSFYVPH